MNSLIYYVIYYSSILALFILVGVLVKKGIDLYHGYDTLNSDAQLIVTGISCFIFWIWAMYVFLSGYIEWWNDVYGGDGGEVDDKDKEDTKDKEDKEGGSPDGLGVFLFCMIITMAPFLWGLFQQHKKNRAN